MSSVHAPELIEARLLDSFLRSEVSSLPGAGETLPLVKQPKWLFSPYQNPTHQPVAEMRHADSRLRCRHMQQGL